MKKNININLCGIIYAIDEDAYQLLEQYLDNIRAYFSKQAGGQEIADDIEHRVAELLWEKKQQGVEAIDVMTIKTILKQIGNPEEMTDAEGNTEEANSQTQGQESATSSSNNQNTSSSNTYNKDENEGHKGKRKLYRDPNNKMLGGVISGLAHYMGNSDPLPWRIGICVLVFCGQSLWNATVFSFVSTIDFRLGYMHHPFWWLAIIAYLIAWMLIPEAQTVEQKLEMRGREVTPESIQEEVIAEQEKSKQSETPAQQSSARGCLNSLLSVLVVIIKVFFFVVGGSIILGLIIALFSMLIAVIALPSHIIHEAVGPNSSSLFFLFVVSLCVIVGLPIYLLSHRLFSKVHHSNNTRLILLVVWLLAWAGVAYTGSKIGPIVHESNFRDFPGKLFHRGSYSYYIHTDDGTTTRQRSSDGTTSFYSEEITNPDGSVTRIEHEISHTDSGTVEKCDTLRLPAPR